MIKKKILNVFLLMAVGWFFLGGSAQALYLEPMAYNSLFFRGVEVFDKVNSTTPNDEVAPGDLFWGVMTVNDILYSKTDPTAQTGSSLPYSEISAYFVLEVDQVKENDPNDATDDVIIFGAPTYDPNQILDVSTGEVIRVYEDPTPDFDNTNVSTGVASATNGTVLWSLGFNPSTDGDSTGGYWYSLAPIQIPSTNSKVGSTYGGLNFIKNAALNTPGGEMFKAIDDPNETNPDGTPRDVLVEFFLNSEISKINSLGAVDSSGTNRLWEFAINDPAVLYPLPEPATMLLLGSGLIGIVGVGRRKMRK